MWKMLPAVAALIIGTGTANAANLLVNGGFETGLEGWTCSGAELCLASTDYPLAGQSLEVFANEGVATLTQSFATVAGTSYKLSFWTSIYDQHHLGNSLAYSLNGGAPVVVEKTKAYAQFSRSFVATGAISTITFFLQTDVGSGTLWLDEVSVAAQ